MDIGAYMQIENLNAIAKANGIDVPRLRGYRLMSDVEKFSQEDLNDITLGAIREAGESWATSFPAFSINAICNEFSWRTDYRRKKYLIYDDDDNFVGFRWNLIHGKKRKNLKYVIKRAKKNVIKQYETYNKYAGRDDVLYIHARIGGLNWYYYEGYKLETEPWFLEKVDDFYDDTYCDIYAKIDKSLVEKKETT